MKNLLSLLSVLTISGTAVPTTIAASPYQKEETIKNSYINYQKTNNLESLNRNKRQGVLINNRGKSSLRSYITRTSLSVYCPAWGPESNGCPDPNTVKQAIISQNNLNSTISNQFTVEVVGQGAGIATSNDGSRYVYGSVNVYWS